ncbi:CLUMA_CG017050, isoform A [Clunio marinus]|uniref:CLUMA_CG017050, isoform A n=1 Tax=Clunio marinus TaxID=568069 RepID=A0A1J1IZB6_9DIPT|nr:CLUMA_CG017050, isoform A [Clunio marinus]
MASSGSSWYYDLKNNDLIIEKEISCDVRDLVINVSQRNDRSVKETKEEFIIGDISKGSMLTIESRSFCESCRGSPDCACKGFINVIVVLDQPKNNFIKRDIKVFLACVTDVPAGALKVISDECYTAFQSAFKMEKRNFLNTGELMRSPSALLPFYAKISVIEKNGKLSVENLVDEIQNQNLMDFTNNLFLNKQYSDFTFKVGENMFPVHKNVLSYRSSVFQKMFSGGFRESSSKCQEIIDVHPEVFKEMLRFIYTGNVEDLNNNAEELLAVADRYHVTDLQKLCKIYLMSNLSEENALKYFELSHRHPCYLDLKESSFKILQSIFEKINLSLPDEFLEQPDKVAIAIKYKNQLENALIVSSETISGSNSDCGNDNEDEEAAPAKESRID